ncbi:MAG: hypothetical protein AB1651_13080 [Pseudomonadota bacterium]
MKRVRGSRSGAAIYLFILCVLVGVLYLQGLPGEFLFDDYQNIVANDALQSVNQGGEQWLVAAFSSSAGMLYRPLSMLSFALTYSVAGLDPGAFKAVNVAIHLSCALLIFALVRRLAPWLMAATTQVDQGGRKAWGIALLTTALWALHPLHVSGVLYAVQRMNQLAALFTLLGLLCYVEGRLRLLREGRGLFTALGGLGVFGLLAVLSKENGALILAYALVIEVMAFRFGAPKPAQRRTLQAWFVLTLGVPVAAFGLFLLLDPDWLTRGYAVRDFGAPERLLTQARVLFHYLFWLLLPWPPWLGLYHDDLAVSRGLLAPPTTLLAIAGWVLVLGTAWRLRRRVPLFGFAVLWFLAGHAMESTLIPLEMVFEHRNYLPSLGVLFALAAGAWQLASRYLAPAASIGLGAAALLVLAVALGQRTHTWGDTYRLALTQAEHHPKSPRSLYEAGLRRHASSIPADRQRAIADFVAAMELDPYYVHPVASLILVQHAEAAPPDPLFNELLHRVRHAPMLQPGSVSMLFERAADARLALEPEQYRQLFEAAMDNPSVKPTMRASFLNAYGRYQLLVLGDAQSAVSLTLAAAETDPRNPLFQLNLAKLALALEQPQVADHHLQRARELDVSGVYRTQIMRIADEIRAAATPGLVSKPDLKANASLESEAP